MRKTAQGKIAIHKFDNVENTDMSSTGYAYGRGASYGNGTTDGEGFGEGYAGSVGTYPGCGTPFGTGVSGPREWPFRNLDNFSL